MPFVKTRFYIYFLQTLSFFISCIVNRNKKFDAGKVQNILVIRIDRLGDFLMSMPVFHSLRRNFPNQKITLLTGFSHKTLVSGSPLFDEVIYYDSHEYADEKNHIGRLFSSIRVLGRLKKYDLIFDLRSDLLVLLFCLFKVNYYRSDWGTIRTAEKINRFFFSPISDMPKDDTCFYGRIIKAGFLSKFYRLSQRQNWKRHYVEMITSSLNYINIFEKTPNFNLQVVDDKKCQVQKVLKNWRLDGGNLIGLHPGAGNKSKIWKIDNIAFILNKLSEKHQYKFLIIYGPEEEYLIRHLQSLLLQKARCFSNQDLQMVAAVLKSLKLLICNDSGIMHLARAVDTPTIAIFTITHPYFYGHQSPKNLNILVPKNPTLGREMVFRAVSKTLSNHIA